MAQHLADLRKRRATSEHLGRGRVPQPMRADPRHARPVTRRADDPPDRASVQSLARRGHAQEQRPTLTPRATAEIGHERLTDIDRSFVDSFKTELISDRVWRTHTQLEFATVEYVAWFNHVRLHSSLGDIPPVEFEALYAPQYSEKYTQ